MPAQRLPGMLTARRVKSPHRWPCRKTMCPWPSACQPSNFATSSGTLNSARSASISSCQGAQRFRQLWAGGQSPLHAKSTAVLLQSTMVRRMPGRAVLTAAGLLSGTVAALQRLPVHDGQRARRGQRPEPTQAPRTQLQEELKEAQLVLDGWPSAPQKGPRHNTHRQATASGRRPRPMQALPAILEMVARRLLLPLLVAEYAQRRMLPGMGRALTS
jgi:hypothetical protein